MNNSNESFSSNPLKLTIRYCKPDCNNRSIFVTTSSGVPKRIISSSSSSLTPGYLDFSTKAAKASLIKSVAGGIASSALGFIGKEAMGWVMGLLGFKSAEDQTQEQLENIQNSLNLMSTKLNEIDSKLDSIKYNLSQMSN